MKRGLLLMANKANDYTIVSNVIQTYSWPSAVMWAPMVRDIAQDFYAGKSIQTFLSDYQSRPEGGSGLMRIMTFSKKKDLIRVRTFSPYTGVEEKDGDSEFTRPWLYGTNSVRFA